MKSKIKRSAFCLLFHQGQRRFLTRLFRFLQQPSCRQWQLPQQNLRCRELCHPPELASYHRAPHCLSWHQWFWSITEGGRRIIRQDTSQGCTCTKPDYNRKRNQNIKSTARRSAVVKDLAWPSPEEGPSSRPPPSRPMGSSLYN